MKIYKHEEIIIYFSFPLPWFFSRWLLVWCWCVQLPSPIPFNYELQCFALAEKTPTPEAVFFKKFNWPVVATSALTFVKGRRTEGKAD
jgi:hypothetical protein